MHTHTKRLLIGGALASGSMLMAAGLVIGAGIAKADGYDFTADLTALGMHNDGGAAAQLHVGQIVCRELSSGWTPRQAARDMYVNSQLNLAQSYQFVDISIRDLCPWNAGPWDGAAPAPDSTVGYTQRGGRHHK